MEMWSVWIITGFVFMLLETLVPGGIIVFVGSSAVITGALVKFNILPSLVDSILFWFISSIASMFFLRSFFMKFFEGDSSKQITDEDEDSKGKIVFVIENILPHKEGRIRFRGSTWKARSSEEILEGQKALIIKRDNSIWIVKSLK